MNYTVEQMVLCQTMALPIDLKMYRRLDSARNVLLAANSIEEKYDILIQNYMEFERELLNELTQRMILSRVDYDDSYHTRTIINRRVVNLLTSTKMYYDHLVKHVRDCLNDENLVNEKVKGYFSNEYDTSKEYRFMEALRNHVQHYGLAVHSLIISKQWEDDIEDCQMANKIKLISIKENFEQNSSFKKSVLNELEDKTDLIKSIRVYVQSLNNVHMKIRNLIDSPVAEARKSIEEIISEYEKINNGDSIGLYACCRENETIVEKFPLLLEWDDVRLNLVRRNKLLSKLSQWYVSGSIR